MESTKEIMSQGASSDTDAMGYRGERVLSVTAMTSTFREQA